MKSFAILSVMIALSIITLNEAHPNSRAPMQCMAMPYCQGGVCKAMCGKSICDPPCRPNDDGGIVHCMAMPYCKAGKCMAMCGKSICSPPCNL